MQGEKLSLGDRQNEYEQTVNLLNSEILDLFKEKDLDQLTWENVQILVDHICSEFKTMHKNYKSIFKEEHQKENLCYHFYRFCYDREDNRANFKEITLRALALEWGAEEDTEILYRGAQISADDIIRDKGWVHSLSFSPSLFAGLVFEGTPSGTCSYVYYNALANKQLYALRLPRSKLEKYFFYPILFKSCSLLPLIARGEFSHPRLRVFMTEGTKNICGAQNRVDEVKRLAVFIPTTKINGPAIYREKVVKLFQKNIRLLAV